MSVTITFYTFEEKKPKHQESIIWLRSISSFGFEGFDPTEVDVEYCWFEVDEEGYHTGDQVCYDSEDDSVPDGCKLEVMFDGYVATDDMLWIGVEEYWKCFDKHRGMDDGN